MTWAVECRSSSKGDIVFIGEIVEVTDEGVEGFIPLLDRDDL